MNLLISPPLIVMPAIETIPQQIVLEDSLDVLLPDSPVIDGHLKMGGSDPHGNRIDVNSHYLKWNGRPWMPTMGEMPFFRFFRKNNG